MLPPLTARSTSRNQTGSPPAAARTTAPPISMLIVVEFRATASTGGPGPHAPSQPEQRVALVDRQARHAGARCLTPHEKMLRRDAVPARHLRHDRSRHMDSATIRPLTSSLQRRRRPAPAWISTPATRLRSANYRYESYWIWRLISCRSARSRQDGDRSLKSFSSTTRYRSTRAQRVPTDKLMQRPERILVHGG